VYRCRSWCSDRYGHIADSVRAKQAVRGTACFVDSRPFCHVTWVPGLLVWLVHAVHPGRPVLRRSARDGRRAGLVRTRGRGRLSYRPAPSLRGCHGGGDRVRVARRRVEDWHGAVASDAARGSGRCASGGVMPQGFPGIPSQGLDLVEPVMYLSWTDDAPVVHPPYICAGNAPDHEAARSACCGCERGARTAEVDLA